MSQTIALINLKGGVGKTVSSINIATFLGMNFDAEPNTLVDLMTEAIDGEITPERIRECIYAAGAVDILPSNFALAKIDYKLMNAYNRESVLKSIIDCPPSLGLIVTNALTASDRVLISVEAQYLSFESLKVMLGTIEMVRKKLSKGIKDKICEIYGDDTHVFADWIPYSIKAAEQTLYGRSLIDLEPNHPVSAAYMNITKELIADGR